MRFFRSFRYTAILALALCAVFLCACATDGGSGKGAGEVLGDLMAQSGSLPVGVIYSKSAGEGTDGHFSPKLARTMYGERAEELLSLTEDFAIYVSSFGIPAEIAVFKCYSRSDAERIGAMCLSRAESVRVLLRSTEWRGLADGASVRVDGRWVIAATVPQTKRV